MMESSATLSSHPPPSDVSAARPREPALSSAAPWRDIAAYLHPVESWADFGRLRDDLHAALTPADAIERLWCDDIIALVWESHRLRRAKRVLLEAQAGTRTSARYSQE